METLIQPKITGHRQLSEEAALMNETKAHAVPHRREVDAAFVTIQVQFGSVVGKELDILRRALTTF